MGKTLIITAGGVKGFLALGGIFALKSKNLLSDYTDFCGVSVGSILTTLLALNLEYPELLTESLEFDFFNGFNNALNNFNILDWFQRQKEKKLKGIGILNPTKIRDRIEYWMIVKYRKKMSFLDLYNYTGNTLTIVVTDLSDVENPKPVYLNWKNTPNYSIAKAVMESCSIPGVFELENPSKIDGVFSDPFPFQIVNTDQATAFILQEDFRGSETSGIGEALLHIYSAMLIPIKILLQEKIERCPKNIIIIQLKRTINGIDLPIPFNMASADKLNMIISGFEQTIEQL